MKRDWQSCGSRMSGTGWKPTQTRSVEPISMRPCSTTAYGLLSSSRPIFWNVVCHPRNDRWSSGITTNFAQAAQHRIPKEHRDKYAPEPRQSTPEQVMGLLPVGTACAFSSSLCGFKLIPSNGVLSSREKAGMVPNPTHQPSSPLPGRSAGVLTQYPADCRVAACGAYPQGATQTQAVGRLDAGLQLQQAQIRRRHEHIYIATTPGSAIAPTGHSALLVFFT